MPQQTEPATPTRLSLVSNQYAGKKLRLAGRLLAYEPETALILLVDHDNGILVDVSLCIGSWIRDTLDIIMVIGHVETSLTLPVPRPSVQDYATNLKIDPHIVLRAILVVPGADLDMDLWNATIAERDTFFQSISD